MMIVNSPKDEDVILRTVEPSASADEIYESLVIRAESCVDHLCGCSD